MDQAVIDWGDVHFGNRALDLSIAYTFFPPEGRCRFQDIYGADPAIWALARFRALYHTLAIIDYTQETGQTGLFKEALRSLTWTLQTSTDRLKQDGPAPARRTAHHSARCARLTIVSRPPGASMPGASSMAEDLMEHSSDFMARARSSVTAEEREATTTRPAEHKHAHGHSHKHDYES